MFSSRLVNARLNCARKRAEERGLSGGGEGKRRGDERQESTTDEETGTKREELVGKKKGIDRKRV